MKKHLFLLSITFLMAVSVSAQFRKVPAEVTEAFKSKYPTATEVSWSDKLTSFGAAFTLNGEKQEADFSAKGVWKKTERDLAVDSLPTQVERGFAGSKYNTGWKIKAARHTENSDESVEYRLLIEKSVLQKKYLYLDADGTLIREAVTL